MVADADKPTHTSPLVGEIGTRSVPSGGTAGREHFTSTPAPLSPTQSAAMEALTAAADLFFTMPEGDTISPAAGSEAKLTPHHKLRTTCPSCSAGIKYPSQLGGDEAECPKCKFWFTLPTNRGDAAHPLTPEAGPTRALEWRQKAAKHLIQILPCPTCHANLAVMPEDVGLDVQCGGCQSVFEATPRRK